MASAEDGRLDVAVEAIVRGVYDSGALYDPHRWWPRSYLPYSPLFAEDFHGRWIASYQGAEPDRLASDCRGTQLWVLLAMASRALKGMMEVDDRVGFVSGMLDVIERTEHGDLGCPDGAHRVWSEDQVVAAMADRRFLPAADAAVNKAFSQLNGNLLMYAEGVFFSANCTIRDVHGPYDVTFQGEPCQLLVREYHQLREPELEQATAAVSYGALTTYSLYRPEVGFSFTVLNDYSSDLPLPQNALAHAAEAVIKGEKQQLTDGDAARAASDALAATVADVTSAVQGLDEKAMAHEIVRRVYFRAAPVAAVAGMPWMPSAAFVDSFLGALEAFTPRMPPEMTRQEFATLVDPRS
jgi:hypothetical protein